MALPFLASLFCCSSSVPQEAPTVLEPYSPQEKVRGDFTSVGSDTLNNLIMLWSEVFAKRQPGTVIQIEGKGTSTAVPALIQGQAHWGPMSRPFKPEEIDAFRKAKGYPPTAIRVACDALGVFVHPDNPIEELSLEQLDAIWSKSRRRGHPAIKTWGEAGAPREWAGQTIVLYGRNSASGYYGFFKDQALLRGDFLDEVREQPSGSPILSVTVDKLGMGYSGIGYLTKGVKALRLAPRKAEKAVAPTLEHALDGSYPLSRFLTIAVDKPPDRPLPPPVREFLRFVLSKEGQEVVIKDGYLPLSPALAADERKKLE